MQEVDSLEREVAVLRSETSRLTAEVDRSAAILNTSSRSPASDSPRQPGDRVYKLPPTPAPPDRPMPPAGKPMTAVDYSCPSCRRHALLNIRALFKLGLDCAAC